MKTTLTILVGLAITSVVVAQGSNSKHHETQQPRHGGMSMQMGHGMGKGMGMKMKMDMMSCVCDMQAGQAKLEALASKMNHSQGADRIDATTAVVNQMLANQKAMMKMCMNMMSMHDKMPMPSMPPMHGGHHGQ